MALNDDDAVKKPTGYVPDVRPGIIKRLEAQRIAADPVGPPAPLTAPGPSQSPEPFAGKTHVEVNPTATQAGLDTGFTRPAAGAWSASNPDPNAVTRPTATPPANTPAATPPSATPGTPAPAQPDPNIPVLATATPATAANATEATAAARTPGDRFNVSQTSVPGVSRIDGAKDGAPIFTNRPDATFAELATNDGSLRPGVNVIASENFSKPAPGVAYSDATGGGTLALGDGPTRPRIDPVAAAQARATAERIGAQMDAASDLRSIATHDFRSPLGDISRQAQSDLKSGKITKEAFADTMKAAAAHAVAPVDLAAKAGEQGIADANANERQRIQSDAGLKQALLTREVQKPTQVNLKDGTLGLVGSDGVVRPAVDRSGKAVQVSTKPTIDQSAFAKAQQENVARILGLDPTTGMIVDKNAPGGFRPPTGKELLDANTAAHAITMRGLAGDAEGGGQATPDYAQWLPQARAANPGASDADLKALFTKNYGG